MAQDKTELCTIRIIFPVNSDEQAIEVKKKISALLDDVPDAQIQFSIMNAPRGRPIAPQL